MTVPAPACCAFESAASRDDVEESAAWFISCPKPITANVPPPPPPAHFVILTEDGGTVLTENGGDVLTEAQ